MKCHRELAVTFPPWMTERMTRSSFLLLRLPVVPTMPREDPEHRPLEDLPQLRQGDQVVA